MNRKIKYIASFLLLLIIGFSYGQEHDDLYFNKRDRKKDRAQREQVIREFESRYLPSDEEVTRSRDEGEATSFLGRQYFNYSDDSDEDFLN
ncbi:MAG: hypothetical protein AAF789_13165, partial [Bacteroidota bacterium]